ncbi:hypothetical protein, partial [Polynucleobacter sp. AP-Reno-20A-A9]|uniref:hypothetical protein n=1 Tax=Polynucleobacter sp. AP-Reno-20A-A9 TaxID=2576925 RepID=UPI001C0E536D
LDGTHLSSDIKFEYDEGIVQGVVKATQTGILWSQVQVLVGPPEMQTLISNGGGFVFLVKGFVMVASLELKSAGI